MITKLTVTNDDGSVQDFFPAPAVPTPPTQIVEVHVGDVIEIKGV